MNGKKITCRRCKGTGLVKSHVIYAGIPGGCFLCATTGSLYADKFDRMFADAKGDFYGFTTTFRHGLFLSKSIGRCVESDIIGVTKETTWKKITEEQARAFFAKYGDHTYIDLKK